MGRRSAQGLLADDARAVPGRVEPARHSRAMGQGCGDPGHRSSPASACRARRPAWRATPRPPAPAARPATRAGAVRGSLGRDVSAGRMEMATRLSPGYGSRDDPLRVGLMSDQTVATAPRYYALDCVRAAAMLLGVFYHAIMFIGGDGGRTTAPGLLDWIHSFRMPLFFLISGFFGQMMLGKYGLSGYLRRRWWRIGLPLFCAALHVRCDPLLHWVRRTAPTGPGSARRPTAVSSPGISVARRFRHERSRSATSL